MNFDDVFNAKNTQGISPEKLAFFKAMANQQSGSGGNAQSMLAALMSISGNAQKQGVTFTESERDLMLELLVSNLSPEEGIKARGIIQMMKQMKK